MSCPFGHGVPSVDLDYTPIADEPLPVEPSETPSKNTSGGTMGTMRVQVPEGISAISYGEYLQLDGLLSLQAPRSTQYGKPAHDEPLFICVHQVYELWFKQVLHEIDSVASLLTSLDKMADESPMLKISQRLQRVTVTLKLCVAQFDLLFTMSPMDFESFRSYLVPSSGFQSEQFRLLENKLGVRPQQRIKYHGADYKDALTPEQKARVVKSEEDPSLLQLIEAWLERTPGVKTAWWDKLADNVRRRHEEERAACEAIQDAEVRANELASCDINEKTFANFFSPEAHAEALRKGTRRLSHEALKGALLIFLFRDQPRFQLPYAVLLTLQDIDTNLLEWRHKHASLVQRMIGTKMGTGGSSGYMYLRSTVSDRYKVFLDIANLSTYLVPRELIPPLDKTTMELSAFPSAS
mmetsp:Transcript_56736/g.78689  ORF Transcript_56736/g.78689 Transcript_56736/m.78689 type:complete len:409 (+) Transcript_56736:187-1413(+)